MKTILLISILVASNVAMAQSRRGELENRVLTNADRTVRLLNRNIRRMTVDELRQANTLLLDVQQIARGNVPPPPRGVYSAECHIDDDNSFDKGVNVIGVLRSNTLRSLFDDCKQVARDTYGVNHSSGLVNLQVNEAQIPAAHQVATCHMDDDTSMDFNVDVLGSVAGADVQEVLEQCKMVAKATYGINSSSGIMNLNSRRQAPRHLMRGTCHVDDDTSFDPNVLVVGQVWGQDVRQLNSQCKEIARATYGINSSSGVRDIR